MDAREPGPPEGGICVGPVGEARKALAGAVAAAARRAAAEGALPSIVVETLDASGGAHVESPKDPSRGDLACTSALRLAGPSRLAPRVIAGEIISRLETGSLPVERVETAGPGFINVYLRRRWLNGVIGTIREAGRDWGRSTHGGGERVQVEFVSANPTGPLGVVNARAAAVGDTLAALLDAAGYRVEREYYINDTGRQIERLGRSVEARWLELRGEPAEIPEGGYPGEYVVEIAREYEALHGPSAGRRDARERAADMARFAVDRMVADHRRRLEDYGVSFDIWFSQEAMSRTDALEETLAHLRERGGVFTEEGAVWLRTTVFGDDKDRVLVRSDGAPTYFLADIAYHRDKFSRGFRRVIDLWGPDHHGYVPRMKAAMMALGLPEEALEVIIVQMVRLMEGGRPAKMSKRLGQIVPMEELLSEVGRDAARYFFLMRSADSHLDFDLALAKHRTNDNPVYYVQYAHARISSILRQAPPASAPVNVELLDEPEELNLVRLLAEFPEEVAGAATAREPHRLTRYAAELATGFHRFYDTCRVLTDDTDLREARLALVDAARVTLGNVLALCGVSAPERM